MITEIRSYLKDRIAESFPTMKQLPDPIGDDDIATTDLKSYKILFKDTSTEVGAEWWQDTIPVSIELYIRALTGKEIEAFDEIYDDAFAIRNNIINPMLAKSQDEFNDIFPSNISVVSLNTNDSVFKATIDINIPSYFGCA